MKSVTTFVPLVSLVVAASAKKQLSASRLRRLQLKEALKVNFAHPHDETGRALQVETDVSDSAVTTPCVVYSFEGSAQVNDPCSTTNSPTKAPSQSPTKSPTAAPTTLSSPTAVAFVEATPNPTNSPTAAPTTSPTAAFVEATPNPTNSPTAAPTTSSPTAAVVEATPNPTNSPTAAPTTSPTAAFVEATPNPTNSPTAAPTTSSPTAAVVESTPNPSYPTEFPTTPPTPDLTKQAGEMPISVPEPCCDTCSCYKDDDHPLTEYPDSSHGGYTWGSGGGQINGSTSSKSGKGSKSSKSAYGYNDSGADTSALMVSEMLAFKDAQNSAHSRHMPLGLTVVAAVAINALR